MVFKCQNCTLDMCSIHICNKYYKNVLMKMCKKYKTIIYQSYVLSYVIIYVFCKYEMVILHEKIVNWRKINHVLSNVHLNYNVLLKKLRESFLQTYVHYFISSLWLWSTDEYVHIYVLSESSPLSSYKYLKDPRINMSIIDKVNNKLEFVKYS